MPNDITIATSSHASASGGPAAPAAVAKTQPANAAGPAPHGASTSTSAAAQANGGAAQVSLHSNPVSWFDPAVGLVVLQFYNAQGVKTDSIPSQKQLDSYRLHDASSSGAAPATSSAPSSVASVTHASPSIKTSSG